MTNTYEDAADAEADRAQQLRLLAALGAWDRACVGTSSRPGASSARVVASTPPETARPG